MAKFSDAQDYVLYNYYLMAMKDIHGGEASQEEISPAIQGTYSAPIIRKAIEQLQSDSKLSTNKLASFPEIEKIEITRYGLTIVDEKLASFGGNFIKGAADEKHDYLERLHNAFDQLLGSTASGTSVPASDRYVSVSDNQTGFDELVAHLNKIRDEFANDHKGNELAGEVGQQLLSEIKATKAQIESGWIRLPQLSEGLKPALERAVLAYPSLVLIVSQATDIIMKILQAFGIG